MNQSDSDLAVAVQEARQRAIAALDQLYIADPGVVEGWVEKNRIITPRIHQFMTAMRAYPYCPICEAAVSAGRPHEEGCEVTLL